MKSAQQKFNEYLEESQSTMAAINEVTESTNQRYQGYAFAAGCLGMILADAIGQLPRAQRAEFRARLAKISDKARHEILLDKIKDTV
jgi:hypothetical protein